MRMIRITGMLKGGRLPLDFFVIGESTPAVAVWVGGLAALLWFIF
jgi:hypothetical protein